MKTPDTNYIEKLYRAYYMDVYSYLMTLVKDAHEAEELTQETFFRAMRSKHPIRENQGNVHGCAPLQRICVWIIFGDRRKRNPKMCPKRSMQAFFWSVM